MSDIATAASCVLAAGWITSSIAYSRHLEQARRDPLTHLPTRAGFQRTARRLAKRRDTVIGLVDLDHFKTLNDTYGHLAGGDVALKAAADRLAGWLPPDGIAARIGGDEFAFAVRLSEHDWTCWLDVLTEALHCPVQRADGQRLPISASLGVARVSIAPARRDLSVLMHAADLALYAAKAAGRACWRAASSENYRMPLDGEPQVRDRHPARS